MRTISYKEALANGVAPHQRHGRNAPFFDIYRNLRPMKDGAQSFADMTNPFTAAYLSSLNISNQWPKPTLLRNYSATYMCAADDVNACDQLLTVVEQYSLFLGALTWTAIPRTTWTWADYGLTPYDAVNAYKVPAGSGIWHMADFGHFIILCDGSTTIIGLGHFSKVFPLSTPTINTCASYNEGQLFMGGFNSANLFSLVDWDTFLSSFEGDIPHHITDFAINDPMGENWVQWGTKGGGDSLWLFDLGYCIHGDFPQGGYGGTYLDNYTADDPFIFRLWKRNQFGKMKMPFHGKVQRLAQIGKVMAVFGADGVNYLYPTKVDSETFGLGFFSGLPSGIGTGPNARGCSGGDEHSQLMLDATGDLYLFYGDGNAQRLEYKNVFGSWTTRDDVVISKNPFEKEFYICNTNESWLLTETGLCECPKRPGSVTFHGLGAMSVYETDSDTTVRLRTLRFDGGEEGVWLAGECRIQAWDPTSWSAILYYKPYHNSAFVETDPFVFDDRGVLNFGNIPGVLFKLEVYSATDVQLTGLSIDLFNDGEVRRSIRPWLF